MLKPPTITTTEPDITGGWGFVNPEDMLKRGFLQYLATGTKPRREEIEDTDLTWSNDLDMLMELYNHRKNLKENPQ